MHNYDDGKKLCYHHHYTPRELFCSFFKAFFENVSTFESMMSLSLKWLSIHKTLWKRHKSLNMFNTLSHLPQFIYIISKNFRDKEIFPLSPRSRLMQISLLFLLLLQILVEWGKISKMKFSNFLVARRKSQLSREIFQFELLRPHVTQLDPLWIIFFFCSGLETLFELR